MRALPFFCVKRMRKCKKYAKIKVSLFSAEGPMMARKAGKKGTDNVFLVQLRNEVSTTMERIKIMLGSLKSGGTQISGDLIFMLIVRGSVILKRRADSVS